MRHSGVGLFFLSIAVSLGAAAVEKTSFAQILKRYRTQGAEWQSAESVRQSARHNLREARGRFLPNIYLQGQKTDSRNIFEFGTNQVVSETELYVAQAVLEQPILNGGANWNNLQLKKTEDTLGELAWIETKNQLTQKILAAQLRALVASQTVETLMNSRTTQKKFLDITQNRRRSGAALAYELAQAKADYVSYEARILSAENEKNVALREFKALLGFDPDYPIDINWPELRKQEVTLKWQDDMHKRLDVLQAQHEVEKANYLKRLSISQDLPSLNFRATYGYQGAESSDIGEDDAKIHNYALILNIPLFSGGTGLQKRQAGEALRFAAEKRLRSMERDAANDLLATRQNYVAARLNLTSNREWAKNAGDAIRLGLENYRVGRLALFQVLQLQASYERAELVRIDSERQALMAEMAFYSARGADLYEIYTN